MIESVRIKNFQSHKDTEMEFDPGVNVIVGPSHGGKSATLRAIWWCLENKPNGDGFRSHWGGDTESIVRFGDGVLERVKRKGFNGYLLGDTAYKGFGQGVPDPVAAFVNMADVNFQRQLTPPFMLGLTPGERGALLNRTTDLVAIDRSIQSIKKTVSEEQAEIKKLQANIKQHTESLADFSNLDDIEKKVAGIERMCIQKARLESDTEELEDLADDLAACEKVLLSIGDVTAAEKAIKKIEDLANSRQELREETDDLEDLLLDIEKEENRVKQLTVSVKSAESEFKREFPDVCPLCGVSNET